jgi:hypothetical protein
MDLAERFEKALAAEQDDRVELLPVRLARAAAVLAVDGAGLSIRGSPEPRTPLAASSEGAALAERLQLTAEQDAVA